MLFSEKINGFLKYLWNRFATAEKWQNIISFPDKYQHKGRIARTVLVMILFGILGQALYVMRVFIISKGIGLNIGIPDIAWISLLVVALRLLPVSFAGIGISEWGYAYFFSLLKLSPELGVTVSVLVFSQTLLASVAGWILEMRE